jgi:DNA polymerase-3 subunit epsilon
MNPNVWLSDREWVMQEAVELAACQEVVYLDTETTGLGTDAEVVEVAVVDQAGEVVFESLVRPTRPIPAEATAVHGIGDADVAGAPTFAEIAPALARAILGRVLVIYNRDYDVRLLKQTARAWGVQFEPLALASESWCAMEAYAVFHGQYNDWHSSYTWQKLGNAVAQMKVMVPEGLKLHGARADALCTRLVVRAMAGVRE